ncbi:WbuC family cupin fold metalloprotein, partial [Escherichia coli]|uniref:WbuC family cupin fold metalloprotein n=1 Tax=Escherichia coli TaxID=562 RepID=UPI003EDF4969
MQRSFTRQEEGKRHNPGQCKTFLQPAASDPLKALPGTYVRPHRHPHTFELLLPLRGRFVVLNFDDRGTVTHRAILG